MSAPRLARPDGRYQRLLHGVKYVEGEFLLRCGECHRASRACYWPLTVEFWDPAQGLTRCRACWVTRKRLQHQSRNRRTPDLIRERSRRYYYESREVILLKRRLRYAARKAA